MFVFGYGVRRWVVLVFVCCFIFGGVGYSDGAGDAFWPQFHGPERTNISAEKGLLQKWPEGGPELVWTAKGLGHGYSTVSIAGGLIYTSGNVERDTVITALDLDGQTVWRYKNGKVWTKNYPGTRATPTFDEGRLYDLSPVGNIVCLDAKSGKKIWGYNILDKFGGKNTQWALCESLLVDGDRLICSPGGPKTCMVALNKKDGSVVWEAESTGDLAGYSSPSLVEYGGLRIVVTMTNKAMIGVNADTGELQWRVKHISYADENVLMPIYEDGCVFASTLLAGSVKWKINVKDGKATLEELWRTQEMDNHHGGVVLIDGYLYGTSTVKNRNLWVCLDWETGEMKYKAKGVGKGSVTVADGLLYTFSENRLMGIVRLTPSGHDVISSFEIPKGGKAMSWAHPVVCGGRLYLRHGEFLYAYLLEK